MRTIADQPEWAIVAPFLPAPARTGRPRRWPMRTILDAILSVLRTGGAWRHLPREVPPWPTVHRWFLVPSRPERSSGPRTLLPWPIVNALDVTRAPRRR